MEGERFKGHDAEQDAKCVIHNKPATEFLELRPQPHHFKIQGEKKVELKALDLFKKVILSFCTNFKWIYNIFHPVSLAD